MFVSGTRFVVPVFWYQILVPVSYQYVMGIRIRVGVDVKIRC